MSLTPTVYALNILHYRKSEKWQEGDRMLAAAWEISNSIAFSTVSVDWLTCSCAFSQTFVDAEYRSGRWGGDEGRRTGAEKK